jgi:serine phosphatase RsbU (regulator of sigma subunit)
MSMNDARNSSPQPPDSEPRLIKLDRGARRARAAADSFWQRVSEGWELADLWAAFKAEARESYSHYSQEMDWKQIEQATGLRRVALFVKEFFWAMLMKLSPARRVLLLAALLCLLIGRVTLQGNRANLTFSLAPLAALLLLLLLAMELADRVTMKRDLEIAREIQRWLVPARPPEVPGVEIAFATRPANTVAGDYYDVFFRPAPDAADGQRLLLVVADVAGKSVPAALLMATLQASLQALAAASDSLVELVSRLNRYACAHSLGGMRFTTAFFAEFDPSTGFLEYVCAGHNAPILRRRSGEVERLERGGLPLGILSDSSYQSGHIQLAPADLLLIFTDGLVEAFNAQGEEFGEARLLEALAASAHLSATDLLPALLRAVDAFVGSTRQHDDITSLVLRRV